MSTAITISKGVLVPANMSEAIMVSEMMAKSGMVPKSFDGNPGAVLVAMQMGAELGLSPMAALQNIAVVNGRPTLWGDAALAVCMSHPDFADCVETQTDTAATCTIKRKGREPIARTFSVDDAKKASLWGKAGPWTQYPKRMLQLRARGFALRDSFPDALRGIITTEEAQDYPTGPTELPEGRTGFGLKKQEPKVIEAKVEYVVPDDVADRRKRAVEWFIKRGATEAQLAAYCGKENVEGIGADELANLRELRTAVLAGKTVLAEVMK
jgi:hypothetical protein